MKTELIYSNSVEQLYGELKGRLFADTRPFTRRMVMVSSPMVKEWLRETMSHDPALGICAGIDIFLLAPGLEKAVSLLCPEQHGCIPSKLQLALAIEALLQEPKSSIAEYLAQSNSSKKARMLALRLADVFSDYGRVGEELFRSIPQEDRWQYLLWIELEKLYDPWNYPARRYTAAPTSRHDLQLHFFGINQLTPLHHRFLENVAKYVPVFHYIVSPCQQFWSDIVSDKERVKMEKRLAHKGIKEHQLEELDAYLTDTNPLLANMGKLGRLQARNWEAIDGDVQERYAVPQTCVNMERYANLIPEELITTSEPLTLLKLVQMDLLTLKNPQEEKHPFETYDNTIQVHAVPKGPREVEVVYDLLLEIMAKEGIEPEKIAVVAPNINDYVPYIDSVFGASQIPYHVMSADNALQIPLIRGFLHLLNIATSRWEASKILTLFHTESFQKRHGLNREDIKLLETIVEEAGVRWGRDAQHRAKESLPEEFCSTGTWKHGLGRVLEGLCMFDSETGETHRFCPFEQINYTQAESVGRFIRILQSLENDLLPLEHNETHTLQEWGIVLKNLFESHFIAEDSNEKGILLSCIDELSRASYRIEKCKFPFSSIAFHLTKNLEKRNSHRQAINTRAVQFCSIGSLGPLPMDIIIVLGMADGMFPRSERIPSFHLMQKSLWNTELFSRLDVERYQFIEMLISVRKQIIFTYPSQCGGDSNEHPPSTLVAELLHYLDSAAEIATTNPSHFCIRRHPLLPFHQRYFLPNSNIKNYSQHYYETAQALYDLKRQQAPSFLTTLDKSDPPEEEVPLIITLKDLSYFAKNPLKTFLRKSVGVYIEDEEEAEPDEDIIVSSPYVKTILLRKSLKNTPEDTFSRAKKAGELPNSPFRQIDIAEISEDTAQTIRMLQSKGIDIADTFSIDFDEKYTEVNIDGPLWRMPALIIESRIGTLKIVGRIDHLHRNGLLLFAKNDFKKAIEVWPQILTLGCLIEAYKLPIEKNVFFCHSEKFGEKYAGTMDLTTLLTRFVEYYLDSKHAPAPLMPQWIPALLKKNTTSFEKEISFDDSFKWLSERSSGMSWSEQAGQWQSTAQHLYDDLAKEWYPRSTEKDDEQV